MQGLQLLQIKKIKKNKIMKYQLKDLLDENNILSHVFLNCVSKKQLEKIALEGEVLHKEGKTDEELMARGVEFELKVNGVSVNPKKFFDLYNDQHTRCVEKQATKIVKDQVSEKFNEINEKLQEYQSIIEHWANDINWQSDNLLIKK